MFTAEEIKIANATSRSSGASVRNKDGSLRAVVPKYVESIARKEDKILDYGAGKGAVHTLYLRDKGFDCTAYDFGDNVTEVHDKEALKRQYDVVMCSNVLNTQNSVRMLIETLKQIHNSLSHNGKLICNYPTSPRKMLLTAHDVEQIIVNIFGCTKKVGGTKSAPIWEVSKIKEIKYE